MSKIVLYHGTITKKFTPSFGLGKENHDYGKGFYLTENIDLAKEWAVSQPNLGNGYVHAYELDTSDLKILDFREQGILCWLAELMKHREASDTKRYRILSEKFIQKYGIDSSEYDVIVGWRANASYFYIAKEFVKDNIDVDILEELLMLGDLGIQYCVKSKKAYDKLIEYNDKLIVVDYDEYNQKYQTRDENARNRMRELIDSEQNKVKNVLSRLIEE